MERLDPRDIDERSLQWLLRAIAFDFEPVGWNAVLEKLVSGDMQAWKFDDGVIVTQITQAGPQARSLEILYLAGRGFLDQLAEIVEALEKIAEMAGASRLVCVARRRGLVRKYLQIGAKPVGLVMMKEV